MPFLPSSRVLHRVLLAVALLGAVIALVGCNSGGDDASADEATKLADRVLRLGEELDTTVVVLPGELPEGLQEALNPSATADTPDEDLVRVPVHPDGTLLGSFRIDRGDGSRTFFLLYDVPGPATDVESALELQLNQSPWQVTNGQSSEAISSIGFESTTSIDFTGTAAIRQIEDSAEPTSSVVYIIEVQPATPPTSTPFVLPAARPLPEGFPTEFVLDGMTPITTQWSSQAAGTAYQILLLTTDTTTAVADTYRTVMQDAGWELTNDQAQGFATQLDFQMDSGASIASIQVDAFSEDDSYTAVFFSLQMSR